MRLYDCRIALGLDRGLAADLRGSCCAAVATYSWSLRVDFVDKLARL